jgi:hypothetical protein
MIVINAQLESFRSLKDRTIKLSFETQEPTPEQLQEIALNNQKEGYLIFSGSQLNESQIDAIDKSSSDLYDSQKTPSKRLRNVLYVWFEQDSKGFTTFEDFYHYQMNGLIDNIKQKLV